MKRKLLSLALAILAILPVGAFSETTFRFFDSEQAETGTQQESVLQTIVFKNLSFELNSAYAYEDNGNSAEITFESQNSYMTIAALDGSGEDGLAESYYENSASDFASQLNAEIVSQSDMDINGINANMASFSINLGDSFLEAFMVTVMEGETVYLITCFQNTEVEESDGEKYLNEFNNLVESLKFI